MTAGKLPDYSVHVKDRETEQKQRIGAAWTQDGGRISIQIDPFVVLDFKNPAIMISLFPSSEPKPESGAKKRARKPAPEPASQGAPTPF